LTARWPILALLTLLVGGCLSGPEAPPEPTSNSPVRDPALVWPLLSPVQYDEMVKERHQIPSFDGTLLDTWVWRPKAPEGARFPVLVNFSPYWGNLAPAAETGGDNFGKYLIHYFVPRGYAAALTSVRGTGQSEGCFNLGGDIEKKDAVAEYLARQSWSNGNVAAGGKSYDGTTPQGAATLTPPGLKAIVPVSAISELYKYNYKGGLPYSQGHSFNARYVVQVGWGLPPNDSFKPDDVACPDLPVIAGEGVASGTTGDYTAYWKERDYSATADRAQAALFFIHGLQDWNVKPDHILPWLDRYGGPKKVWLHQWTDRPNGGHVYPFREDWNYTMLRFFDETLKGVDTGFFDEPAVQVQDTAGRWRHEDAWPPSTTETRVHLHSGTLSEAPGSGAARSFRDDGRLYPPTVDNEYQAIYRGEPLQQPLHIAGQPALHVAVASDGAAGKVALTLYAQAPDGSHTVLGWGGLNLRHRQDVRDPQPATPGQTYTVRVDLHPMDAVVPADHRLVLTVGGNGGFANNAFGRFLEVPTGHVMSWAEDGRAFLSLPIRGQDGLALEDPAPLETRCWAC
jgi:X-Pro dipeptidyl-peptidase